MSIRYIADPDSKRFHIDKEGICEPLWGIGNLEWKDIREVFLKRDGACEYICVVVRDRLALRSRLRLFGRIFSSATRAVGQGDLTINATRRGIQGNSAVEFAASMITASLKKVATQVPESTSDLAPRRGSS